MDKLDMGDGSWSKWQMHVLNELERLNDSYTSLAEALFDIKEKAFLMVKQGEEITRLTKEVDALKIFKIQSVTIWSIAQIALTVFCAYLAKR